MSDEEPPPYKIIGNLLKSGEVVPSSVPNVGQDPDLQGSVQFRWQFHYCGREDQEGVGVAMEGREEQSGQDQA